MAALNHGRHPCDGKITVVSDLGLRLAGTLLLLLRPPSDRPVVQAEGIHELRIEQQLGPTREALSSALAAGSSSIFKAFDGVRNEVSTRLREREEADRLRRPEQPSPPPIAQPVQITDIRTTIGGIGSGIGSFFGSRVASLRGRAAEEPKAGLRPMSLTPSASAATLKRQSG